MQWVAKYEDGTVVRQWDKGVVTSSKDLKPEGLKWFRVTEGTGDFNLGLNCDSGKLKFNNLDLQKLQTLKGGERFSFVFDKESGTFKLDDESFDFIDNLILKREDDFFYMQFDKDGIVNVCGRTFYAGVIVDGVDVPFCGSLPKFQVLVDGVNDIYMNGNSPVKSVDGISKYRIILENSFKYRDVQFDVLYEVVYDLIKWQSYVLGKVKSSKTVQSKLYTTVCGKRELNPFISLVAGNVYALNQFMGVV